LLDSLLQETSLRKLLARTTTKETWRSYVTRRKLKLMI